MESKLKKWQERYEHDLDAWTSFSQRFDHREALVKGNRNVKPCCDGDTKEKTPHVRNLCAELIESQVDTTIPAPKVTARHKEDEKLAKLIEDMILDEMDRLPLEVMNDMMERTVPIQGGAFYFLEWDNAERTQSTIGELTIQYIHPKQIVPQDGVYDAIESMDHIFLKLPQTKEYMKRRYGIDVSQESEEEPEARGVDGESSANDLVTQIVVFYRNDNGGIGKYSWVNDVEIEDIEDYQARRLRRCKKCGAVEPLDSTPMDQPSTDGSYPKGERDMELGEDTDVEVKPKTIGGGVKCPYCGSTEFETQQEEEEEIFLPRVSSGGVSIPGAVMTEVPTGGTDEMGNPIVEPKMNPTRIPYYKPDIYPIILQKSVSVFGQLLGDSDIDKIEDQQNTANRLAAKLMDLILKAGSFATLPLDAQITTDNEDMKFIRLENVADKQMIDVFDMQPPAASISSIHAIYQNTYEEARQAIGITDSYLGRKDSTATSGKAKEFSAQQAAGRLESKRVMKEAAYQQLFEAIFKFKLAYADEPRPIITHDETGEEVYEVFDRYDFLKQDAAGVWYWNDQFIFDVDNAAPLAKDRQALWQETRMNFQQGAYGDPTSIDALIFFWSMMEDLHYPGASAAKTHMKKLKEEQMAMQQQQMQMQQQALSSQAEAAAVETILKEGAKKDGSAQNAKKEDAKQHNENR